MNSSYYFPLLLFLGILNCMCLDFCRLQNKYLILWLQAQLSLILEGIWNSYIHEHTFCSAGGNEFKCEPGHLLCDFRQGLPSQSFQVVHSSDCHERKWEIRTQHMIDNNCLVAPSWTVLLMCNSLCFSERRLGSKYSIIVQIMCI